MIDSLLLSYRNYYVALGHALLRRYPLPHPAFKTSFVLSAGVIDMKQKLAGNREGPPRCLLIQPCFRHFDIDSVVTGRHLSLFLMGAALYFDKPSSSAVVETVLRFLLSELSIEPGKLWLTTFAGGEIGGRTIPAEEESATAWSTLGLPHDHVLRCGCDQNFWREGAGSGEIRSGLCGPHAEVFVDLGSREACTTVPCIPGCGCGRFLELANVVFPRFKLTEKGIENIPWILAEAALGLDRVAMVLESVPTVFDTSALSGLKEAALRGPLAGMQDVGGMFTVLDHIRSFCCLLADGARPSGRGRGHILRRLLRNAMGIAGRAFPNPAETLARVGALLPRHPEACCTIDVAQRWESISETLQRELRALAHRTPVEHRR